MSDLNADQQFEEGRQAAWKGMADLATGKTGVEESQGYTPMESAIPLPKESESLDIVDDRQQTLPNAADELNKGRDQAQVEREGRAVDKPRGYTDDKTGKPIPDNQTLSLEQASWDVTGARQKEQITAELDEAAELQRAIDQIRSGEVTTESLGIESPPVQQPPATQPEVQPQAADEDWQRYLSDPRLLNAVQSHIDQANTQAQQTIAAYNSAAINAANTALAGLVTSYPELKGIRADQLQIALQVVAQQNPQRASDIVAHIGLIHDTVQRGAQANVAQQQQQYVQWRHQFNAFSRAADAEYNHYVRDVPVAERRAVEAEAKQMVMEAYRGDETAAKIAWETSGELRSAFAQRILFDSARARLNEKRMANVRRDKLDRTPPHVQRPGSPLARASEEDYTERQLNRGGGDLTPKQAAELVLHQRARRARGR